MQTGCDDLIDAVAVAPAASVILAVIEWVPTLKPVVEKPAPIPIWPLMLDVQTIFALMLPSSASEADPLKVTLLPETKLDPFAGALIETVGGVFGLTIVSVIDVPAVAPAESVT